MKFKFIPLILLISLTTPVSDVEGQWVQAERPMSGILNLVTQGGIIYASTADSGLFRSTDSGATWIPVKSALADTSLRVCVVMGDVFFAYGWGGKPGVFLSKDSGATWTSCSNGLTDTNIYTLVSIGGNLFVGTPDHGIFRSTDSGNSWIDDNNGITDSVVIAMAALGGNLFAGTDMGSIFSSSDSGESWRLDTLLWNHTTTSFAQVGNDVFVGSDYGISFSSDSGKSWKVSLEGGMEANFVYSFFEYNGNLFATLAGLESIILSTDTGKNWSVVVNGYGGNGIGEGSNFCDPLIACGGYLIAGGDGIWRRPLSQIVPGPAYFTESPDALNFGGLYHFTDSTLSCLVYNAGSGIDTIDSVRIVGADSTDFYVVQYPNSIVFPLLVGPEDTVALPIGYSAPQIPGMDTARLEIFYSHSKDSELTVRLIGSSVVDDVSEQQEILSNATANPNPTGEGTVISFGISQEAYVKIELFDILGHEVQAGEGASLHAEGLFEPGNCSVPISLGGLNSGSYFARIVTNYGEVETVKIVKQ